MALHGAISYFPRLPCLWLQIHVVSAADTFLPLIVADAMRPDLTPEEEEKEEKEGKVRFTRRILIPPVESSV